MNSNPQACPHLFEKIPPGLLPGDYFTTYINFTYSGKVTKTSDSHPLVRQEFLPSFKSYIILVQNDYTLKLKMTQTLILISKLSAKFSLSNRKWVIKKKCGLLRL